MSSLARPRPSLVRLLNAVPAALVLAVLLAFAALAQTLSFPPLTGRVVDQAGILDALSRDRLAIKLAQHETKTSDQIVVATVDSLQGTSIEDFANQLFRHWKLGQQKTNNGVLVLVAPNERKVRIEVGYGLEGSLTDSMSKLIIQAAIAPKFRSGDYGGGLEAGVDAIISTVTGDGEWQERVKLRNRDDGEDYDPLFIFLLFVTIFVIIAILASRNTPPGGGRMHRTRRGDWIILTPGPFSGGGSSSGGFGGGFGGGGGGFSGGGGSSGGGGASGDW